MKLLNWVVILCCITFCASCGSGIKENKDEIYSRHLQKHIKLTIISTSAPDNKSDFNLLLLNDGQLMEQQGVKKIMDSLKKKKVIGSLIVVGVDAFERNQEYGVADFTGSKNNGASAGKYADFIVNELLPFVKKKSGVRKFNSVSFAGGGIGGVSALDIGWDNWQKLDHIGVLPSGFTDKFPVDYTLLKQKITQSRKRPKNNYSFYEDVKAPSASSGPTDSTGIQSVILLLKQKGIPSQNIFEAGENETGNTLQIWRNAFARFLIDISAKQ